ncbi:LuxR family transcriptional regulator [Streptomyces sp. GBA 94-10 4N24]|uniref:helix-turn-helix transcriptional regulator n=1 Tax=Streptomyces sp. GBA 94-10 4N24 TaxID=1218177 RepID=UPI0005611411|nr:LuxR family transcriptional regulator [Streptomyces sp. GBA 94-10 4N24]
MTGEEPALPAVRLHGRAPQLSRVRAWWHQPAAHRTALLVAGEPGLGRTAVLRWAARVLGAGSVGHLVAGPDARLRHQEWTPGALLRAVESGAGGVPALLCADDADQWPPADRRLLREAAERLPEAGGGLLLAAATHRPLPGELAALPVVHLDPLAPEEAAALLAEAVGETVEPSVAAELIAEGEGNPALLHALVHHLSPAALRGRSPLPRPLADAATLARAAGRALTGHDPRTAGLAALVAAATRPVGADRVDARLALRALRRLAPDAGDGPDPAPPPAVLREADGTLGFRSPLLGRTLYATAPPAGRRAAHRALAEEYAADGHRLTALLHRSWSVADGAEDAGLAARLAAEAEGKERPPLRSLAYARAVALAGHGPERATWQTRAAELALSAGDVDRARLLVAAVPEHALRAQDRGRPALVRGLATLADGPAGDAHHALLLAAALFAPAAPERAAAARLAAADAAWAAGDLAACLASLGPDTPNGPEPETADDQRAGMRALLEGRFAPAARRLGRVREQGTAAPAAPEALLRSATAALLLGDVEAARRTGARALAGARHEGSAALVPRALEYLAYAELRAGRHAGARAHAEEGLRAALRSGQRNTAAHHHAVLALAASIEDEPHVVEEHVEAACATARSHGLAQVLTLAQWAAGRADLGRGRPLDAADRLGLLVLAGPQRGHFAVWRLAVPCFVEAAVLAGRAAEARTLLDDFADWAGFGADPQAPAQLARCQALLAPADEADALYRLALDRHTAAGGDFEHARTTLLHGKWLRRRRRPREARDRLGAAVARFARCGAGVWARQARDELRSLATPPSRPDTTALTGLTPQQRRIARHVAQGSTNRETALALSVSVRTVDYHLRRIYAALGVRSRLELARLVDEAEQPATG